MRIAYPSRVFPGLMLLALMAAVPGTQLAEAQEYSVAVINEPAPADDLTPAIAETLSATGYRVVLGGSRTVCEIWLCQQWDAEPDFQPTAQRLYPLQQGHLFGVLRLPRRGSDFRQQDIARGVYTLRMALQPIDGNHVGTSPTRDFVLLVAAAEDMTAAPLDEDTLNELSAAAAGSSHPAMLCLQPILEPAAEAKVVHNEVRGWRILQLPGRQKTTAGVTPLAVGLVIEGHGDE